MLLVVDIDSNITALGQTTRDAPVGIARALPWPFAPSSYNLLEHHRYTATYDNDNRFHHYRFLAARHVNRLQSTSLSLSPDQCKYLVSLALTITSLIDVCDCACNGFPISGIRYPDSCR